MNNQHPDDLEASLRHRAAQFEYPPTPDIARAVRRRTHHATRRPQRRVLLHGALLVVAFAVLLVWPIAVPLRAAVERWWRVGAIEILVATPVPVTPTSLPSTPPMPTNTALRTSPLLVGATTLAQARQRVPFTVRLPSYPDDLGPPEQVFVQDDNGLSLIMLWLDQDSSEVTLSLQVFDSNMVARKLLFADDQAQRTTVDNQPAVWIDVPHVLEYIDPNGQPRFQEGQFVQGNVLIWAEDDLTYRIESTLSLAEARQVAESLP